MLWVLGNAGRERVQLCVGHQLGEMRVMSGRRRSLSTERSRFAPVTLDELL